MLISYSYHLKMSSLAAYGVLPFSEEKSVEGVKPAIYAASCADAF